MPTSCPELGSGSWRRAKGLVVAAWALSFLFSAPILHFYETSEIEGYGTQCWIDFDEQGGIKRTDCEITKL